MFFYCNQNNCSIHFIFCFIKVRSIPLRLQLHRDALVPVWCLGFFKGYFTLATVTVLFLKMFSLRLVVYRSSVQNYIMYRHRATNLFHNHTIVGCARFVLEACDTRVIFSDPLQKTKSTRFRSTLSTRLANLIR